MKIWKRVAALIALAALLAVSARAEIDLSGLSLAELVELRQRVTLAMWETEEWQEVTVPQGVWLVGEDIPAGHWTIKATPDNTAFFSMSQQLEESGKQVKISSDKRYYYSTICSESYKYYRKDIDLSEIDIDLVDGDYIQITGSSVIFTPFSGKPDLGFK